MSSLFPSRAGAPARPSPLLFPLLAACLILFWSSGFVGIRYASEHAPVFLVLFWRTLIAGLVLLPFALLKGPRLTRHALLGQVMFGVLGNFIYLGGFAFAIGWRVPTGLVALTADLVPLAIAALSLPLLGQGLTARQWAGMALGVAGVVIVSADTLRIGDAPMLAYVLPVAGMLSFALAIVLQKKLGATELPLAQSICIQSLTGSVFFALCAWQQGGLSPPADAHFAIGIVWLVLFASLGCYAIYYLCLRLYSPARISSVIYLSPPVTMLWAWAMFDETLTWMMFIGLAVTLAGVSLASAPARTKAEC
jgi:drug/metabolite transporter (DMT)-like permease